MKKIAGLLILISTFGFSQSNKKIMLSNLNFFSIDTSFKIKPVVLNLKKEYTFISYNPNLNLQYSYLKVDKNYQINSISQTFKANILTRNKIDSYNPSGTDSFGGAIVFGVINWILNN